MSMASQLEQIEALRQDPTFRLETSRIAFLLELSKQDGPAPVMTIGRAAGISDRSIPSRIVTTLAKLGLVERLPATNGDLRITRVQLTEAGRIACEKLAKIYPNR
jgi:DNA-binding MarR family transcriptional regulator